DRTAALLLLGTDVDLYEARHAAASLVHCFSQRGDQTRPVERMDRIEQRHRLVRLVRLKLPDEMQRNARMPLAQHGPFALRFLHPVLAERALPGLDQRRDGLRSMGLADGDQRHLAPLAPGDAAGVGDTVLDSGEAGSCAFHRARYSGAMPAR